jgi:hypothetical protein
MRPSSTNVAGAVSAHGEPLHRLPPMVARLRSWYEATEFAAFYEISKRLSSALRMDEVLNLGLDSIREIVPYDFAAIATFDESTGKSVIQAARGEGAEATLQKSFGIEDGLVGWVLDSYRKIFCKGNLHERDQERPIFSKEIKIRGARSILTLPFSVEGRVIGSFTLLGNAANLFSEYEIKIFDVLANQICRVNLNAQCQRGPDVYPFTGRKDSGEATLSVSDALRCFSIRSMVAAPEEEANRMLLKDILNGRTSNFVNTDYLF